MSNFNRFKLGILCVFEGWKIFKSDKSVRRLCLVPFIVDFILLFGALYVGFQTVPQLVAPFLPAATGFWTGALGFIVKIFFSLFSLTISFLVIMIVANIICIPFFSVIAEKVLRLKKSIPATPIGTKQILLHNLNMFKVGLLKALILLVISLACVILSFFPVASLLGSYIGFIIIAFDCSDYALELKALKLSERFAFLHKNLAFYMGAALVVGASCLLPGLNFLLLPLFIIGSSSAVVELINKEEPELIST